MDKKEVEKLVEKAIEKHSEYDNLKHSEILKQIEINHEQVRQFIVFATPVVEAFSAISTSGKLINKVIIIIAKFTIAMGVIVGVCVTLKDWLKRD